MKSANDASRNIDPLVAEGFGDEWSRFDQTKLSGTEKRALFEDYFSIFPWHSLPERAVGADVGCGSGRWASLVAPRVSTLYCIDGSAAALNIARRNLQDFKNCMFIEADVGNLGVPPCSLDFAYCLGVLHHVPDTLQGLRSCVATLKPGAPMLLYLYYRFDNRPAWFRTLWVISDLIRRGVSTLPYPLRYLASQLLALIVYWPLARSARLLQLIGLKVDGIPLVFYADKSFYVMRTDALDRFGTRLEQRFTQREIKDMMTQAGLVQIRFSDRPPYWCAVGTKS
jgi:ubiquinone/menaquinone biosynthesis C-methylase UbiE